ncbi:hypothetical protein B0J14DRAFT_587338 [Halenospora varia]|nr:hypothetical protein B0J14DRAFT_587338 [Halenospora varia]
MVQFTSLLLVALATLTCVPLSSPPLSHLLKYTTLIPPTNPAPQSTSNVLRSPSRPLPSRRRRTYHQNRLHNL